MPINEKPEICPLCGGSVDLVDNKLLYGESKGKWPYVYLCRECQASVGTHPGTDRALGTLADRETRRERKRAHRVFDRMWQRTDMSKSAAYVWLAFKLEIDPKECHIGWFDYDTCKRVASLARAHMRELRGKGRQFMPYVVKRTSRCPKSKPFGIFKKDDGKKVGGCHKTQGGAYAQVSAIEHDEKKRQS